LGGVDAREVFGGVFLEFFDAALAAEADEAVGFALLMVDVVEGVAHAAELFAGDDAGVERVGVGGGGAGERGGREGEEGGGEEGEEVSFHGGFGKG